ncbi:hypothetical protein ACFL6N_05085, partial [Thermodesulfobacteriota bacterium]
LLHDEFWGKYQNGAQVIDFWSGVCHSFAGAEPRRGKKHGLIEKTLFGVKMEREIATPFELLPERRTESHPDGKEIDIGSPEFHQSFYFSFTEEANAMEQEIKSILSEELQAELIELRSKVSASVSFQSGMLLIALDGLYLRNIPTKLSQISSSEASGIEEIENKIHLILASAGAIVNRLTSQ